MEKTGEEWDVQDGEFTEGKNSEIVFEGTEDRRKFLERTEKEKVTPKVTDVPFEKKEIKEDAKAPTKAEEAKGYKKLLVDLGFHKKQNGDDKEQYMYKEGNIVIGRTFSEKLPTGKFWALENNKFLEPDDVKKLKIVQAFYDVRAGKKNIEEVVKEMGIEAPKPFVGCGAFQTPEAIVPSTEEAIVHQTPNAVINEAQGMATALYHVVEKQHLYMDIGGKKYLQLEAWQLLGKFCNVHGLVEEVQPVEYFGAKGFEARAVVRDNKGVVIAAAEAVCMSDEENWKGKPLFQLKSMAQTRSLSKAYRSSLSFIVSIAGYAATPAEEMQGV
jgi:hypothetical protein